MIASSDGAISAGVNRVSPHTSPRLLLYHYIPLHLHLQYTHTQTLRAAEMNMKHAPENMKNSTSFRIRLRVDVWWCGHCRRMPISRCCKQCVMIWRFTSNRNETLNAQDVVIQIILFLFLLYLAIHSPQVDSPTRKFAQNTKRKLRWNVSAFCVDLSRHN